MPDRTPRLPPHMHQSNEPQLTKVHTTRLLSPYRGDTIRPCSRLKLAAFSLYFAIHALFSGDSMRCLHLTREGHIQQYITIPSCAPAV